MNSRFLKYLNKVDDSKVINENIKSKKNIVLIDFMNMFYRNYLSNKFLDVNGYHCGGIIGTLNSIKYTSNFLFPDKIIICYEGNNSTERRKMLNENYKYGRKQKKISPFKEHEYRLEEPDESLSRQIRICKEALTYLPVIQIEQTGYEADDIIAYLSRYYKNENVTIVSTDSDYYQLITDNVVCYNPIQKKFINKNYCIQKHQIHPTNYLIAKSIMGDKSDNLKGVTGIGEKSISKYLSFLKEEKQYTLDDVFDYCHINQQDNIKYKNIIKNKDVIKTNFKIMNLSEEMTSVNSINILSILNSHAPKSDYTNLFDILINYNVDKEIMRSWIKTFSRYQ